MTFSLLAMIFLIAASLNYVWDNLHCRLYYTCRVLSFFPRQKLLLGMGAKDGIYITFCYGASAMVFSNVNILSSAWQLSLFIVATLAMAFMFERVAIATGRWQYEESMPLFFGAGVSPFVKIATTGVITFGIVFNVLGYGALS